MRKTMIAALTAVLVLPILAACGEGSTSSDAKDAKAVNKQQEQYAIGQPIPMFDYSLERDVYVQLYRARNENVATHTIWRSALGKVLGDCPSIGYPIPYDSSLTNPMKIGRALIKGGGHYGVIEQAEPNGLYSSKNSIATWIRCVIQEEGIAKQVPVYVEDQVTAYPYPVTVDYTTDRVAQAGAASVVLQDSQR